MSEIVKYEQSDAVAVITLHRPESMNSFNTESWSREAVQASRQIKLFQAHCKRNKLFHIHYNMETSKEVKQDLATYQKEAGLQNADLWAQASKGDSLIESLRIKRAPIVVILHKDGSIKEHKDAQSYFNENKLR